MYKKLNEVELNEFVEKYMPEWKGDIVEVSYMDFYGLKCYLVNGHYIVAICKNRVVTKDLQIS